MRRQRRHRPALKRPVVEEHPAGAPLHVPPETHEVRRDLPWVRHEELGAGAFDGKARAADMLHEREARIAAPERLLGTRAPKIELPRRGCELRTVAEKRASIRHHRPRGFIGARRRELMGGPCSSCRAPPPARSPIEEAIAAEIGAICEASPAYGHRRVGAEPRHRGQVVDARRVRRVTREQELRPRRRGIATPDGDHGGPILANVARDLEVHGPDPARLGDIAFLAPEAGLAHLALAIALGVSVDGPSGGASSGSAIGWLNRPGSA